MFENLNAPTNGKAPVLPWQKITWWKETDPKQLKAYIDSSINSMDVYFADSVPGTLTVIIISSRRTGFSCLIFLPSIQQVLNAPIPRNIIPELVSMLRTTKEIYAAYNAVSLHTHWIIEYLNLYDHCIEFADKQDSDPNRFDHFHFIKDYVNPLFALNQQLIRAITR